jgi:hypothetical protein
MNAVLTGDFGSFLSIHDFIDQQTIPPSAKRLWGALYGFYKTYGQVWISRDFFAKKLSLRKETISRGLKSLEEIGALERTGELKFNLFPCVILKSSSINNEIPVVSSDLPPVIKRSPPSDQTITDQRPFDHPKKKREELIKEQTDVDFDKKIFSSNDKIALKQKLKIIGLHKNAIEKLVAKFSAEKLNEQIEHLQYVINRGDSIISPASWLRSALEENYPLPREINKNLLEDERKAELVREANYLAQQAKFKLDEDNLEGAKELALKSLQLAKLNIAEDTLKEANERLERNDKLQIAKRLVSEEKKQSIWQEERDKKFKEMTRWYKKDSDILNNALFNGAVEASVNERLLALV